MHITQFAHASVEHVTGGADAGHNGESSNSLMVLVVVSVVAAAVVGLAVTLLSRANAKKATAEKDS